MDSGGAVTGEIGPRQGIIVADMLRNALEHAASNVADPGLAEALRRAAAELSRAEDAPDPGLPVRGSAVQKVLRVHLDDTASAMGHPDPTVAVLGSPRIALWFELVSSDMLASTATTTHVGVGILVHHHASAAVGEDVVVRATVTSASGRRITFTCDAVVGDRLVATGIHHRVVLARR